MRPFLFIALLIFSSLFSTLGQEPDKTPDGSLLDAPATIPTPNPGKSVKGALPASPLQGYTFPDAKQRRKNYVNSMFGPAAIALTTFSAGVSTATNSPKEWGGQWEGFGKRVASNFGRNMIRNTVVYGADEALKLDSHFYRSQKRNFSSRVVNALIAPVTARNRSGKRVIGVPRLAGTYASSMIATYAWFPERYDYKDALRTGTVSLGTNALYNLIKEFVFKK